MTKKFLYVSGAVFVAMGVLGFFYNPLLGLFEINTAHNIIHLVSGILAIGFATRGETEGKTFALILGVVYLLVSVLGFIQGDGKLLSVVAINGADNFLHLFFAVVFLGVGLAKPAGSMAPARQS